MTRICLWKWIPEKLTVRRKARPKVQGLCIHGLPGRRLLSWRIREWSRELIEHRHFVMSSWIDCRCDESGNIPLARGYALLIKTNLRDSSVQGLNGAGGGASAFEAVFQDLKTVFCRVWVRHAPKADCGAKCSHASKRFIREQHIA